VSAQFVAGMEAVLDLYAEPAEPARPVVCVDERPLKLTAPRRPSQPLAPGRPRRQDYEYERCGGATIFAAFVPHAGWRTVEVRDRRTAQDFARFVRDLIDVHFPDAERIRLVLDNLNTHTPGALYETFTPAEARRLARRLEWHYTPKHGSWLNMIELEFSILARQCLDQHLPDRQTAQRHFDAWAAIRNQAQATVNWQFTTPDARRTLHSLYPRTGSS
jgi:hypothetical protein